MPKISVAIITYNREAYLRQAIESILRQTEQDFEVRIFDNASNYNIKGLVESFADNRISLDRLEQNIGALPNMTRAYGYNYNSPYLMVFHDDDYLHPQCLEISLRELDKHPAAAFFCSSMNFVDSSADITVFSSSQINIKTPIVCSGPTELVREILSNRKIDFSSIVYRKNKLINFDSLTRFGKWCDRPFFIEVSKNGGALIARENLVNYRIHTGQDSQSPDELARSIELGHALFGYYKNNLPLPLSPSDKKLFLRFVTNSLVLFASTGAKNWQDYKKVLLSFQPDYFDWKYLNLRGFYYLLKVFKRFYL